MQDKIQVKKIFTEDELVELGKQLSQVEIDKADTDADKKIIMKQYKDKIDRFNAQISELSAKINEGWELEDRICKITFDKAKRVRLYICLRTGEVLDERPFTKEDYQEQIPFEAEPITSSSEHDIQ